MTSVLAKRPRSDLPGVLGEIADVAGERAALALAIEKGGTHVHIPPRVDADHWLVEIVGASAAELICEHFRVRDPAGAEKGARHLWIPLGPGNLLVRARAACIRELLSGTSIREAAQRAGLTERSAYRIQAQLRGKGKDDRQGSLF